MAEYNSGDLSAQQTEKLLQFQDLTGIENIERCRQILNQHSWNLETAVHDTFNEREGVPSVFVQPQPVPLPPNVDFHPTDQAVYRSSPRQPQSLLQWGYLLVTLPFRFVYDSLLQLIFFALRLVRPDTSRNVPDPVGDVVSFITHFNTTYGSGHPVFYQGSYSQALSDAKRELQFLLVYLHGDDHQDTADFCRLILCNEAFIEFVNGRVLFWACNVNSPEGSRVSQALRENTYPFLALVVLRDNRMTVVARIEGFIDAGELIQRISVVMETNESSLVAARAERAERNLTQNLRQEQDVAYEVSLKADREKERKKREEREEKEEIERRQKEEDENLMMQIEHREELKESYRQEMPEEPSSHDPDSIRVMLKLPSGQRLERRFLKTQSLKYLYYYVLCHADCPDSFTIVKNFPRCVIPCDSTDPSHHPPTFEQAGLGKSEMLFVQDNEA